MSTDLVTPSPCVIPFDAIKRHYKPSSAKVMPAKIDPASHGNTAVMRAFYDDLKARTTEKGIVWIYGGLGLFVALYEDAYRVSKATGFIASVPVGAEDGAIRIGVRLTHFDAFNKALRDAGYRVWLWTARSENQLTEITATGFPKGKL